MVSALSSPKAIRTCCAAESPASSTRRTPETLAAAALGCSKPAAGRSGNSRGHRRRSPPPSSVPLKRNASWCCTPRPQTRVGRTRGGSQPADRQDVREPHPGQIRTGGPAGSGRRPTLPRGGATATSTPVARPRRRTEDRVRRRRACANAGRQQPAGSAELTTEMSIRRLVLVITPVGALCSSNVSHPSEKPPAAGRLFRTRARRVCRLRGGQRPARAAGRRRGYCAGDRSRRSVASLAVFPWWSRG